MHKLSRLLLHDCGFLEGYFNELLLDLRQRGMGRAADHLIHAINGLCKTSLLSLFFSLFRPDKREFLKSRIDKEAHFDDYFRPGHVGYIVAEFELAEPQAPKLFEAPPRHLVIGQAVYLKPEAPESGSTTERWFFAFSANDRLDLDRLPIRGLASGGETLESLEQLRAWLKRWDDDSSSDFWSTDEIGKWVLHLEERGLDPSLMKIQQTFSESEGGVGTAWLNFKSEREFVHNFLTLVLPIDEVEQTRKLLLGQVERLRNLPRLEAQRELLAILATKLNVFEESAHRWCDAVKLVEAADSELAGLALLAEEHGRKAKQDEAQAKGHAKSLAEKREHLQLLGVTYRGQSLGLRRVAAKKRMAEAEEALAATKNRHAHACHLLRAAKSEEIRRTVDISRTLMESLRIDLQEALDEAAPYMYRLEQTGRQLSEVLEAGLVKSRRTVAEAAEMSLELDAATKKLDGELKVLRHEYQGVHTEHALASQTLERTRATLEAWRREHLLMQEEDPAEAVHRLEANAQGASSVLETLREQEKAIGLERQELSQGQREQELAIARLEESLADVRARYQDALSCRETISTSERLQALAQTTDLEPDRPDLLNLLDDRLEDLRRQLSRAQLAEQKTREDLSFLDTHGLSAADPDVAQVVQLLTAAGIKAGAYETYLAETIRDLEEARALMRSDSARYAGVGVYGLEHLERARALLAAEPPRLGSYVVVSPFELTAADANAAQIVVPSFSAGRFNKGAAQDERRELADSLERQSQHVTELRGLLKEAEEILEALRTYRREHGPGCVTRYQGEIETLLTKLEEAAEHRQALKERAETLETRVLPTLKQQIDEAATKVSDLQGDVSRVKAFLETEWSRYEEACEKTPRLRIMLESLEAETAAHEGERERLQLAAFKTAEEGRDAHHEAERQSAALERLVHVATETVHPHPTLDATGLQRLYDQQFQAWQQKADSRVAVFQTKLQHQQEQLGDAERRYRAAIEEVPMALREAFSAVVNLHEAIVEADAEVVAAAEAELLSQANEVQVRAKRDAIEDEVGRLADDGISPPEHDPPSDLSADQLEIEAKAWLAKAREVEEQATSAAQDERVALSRASDSAEIASLMEGLESRIDGALPDEEGPEPIEPPEPIPLERLKDTVDSALERRKVLGKTVKKELKAIRDHFYLVQDFAGTESFRRCEPGIASRLTVGVAEDAARDASALGMLFRQRIQTVDNDLATMESDREQCVSALAQVVDRAWHQLTLAERLSEVPLEVPVFGGEKVLIMKHRRQFTQADKHAALDGFLRELINSGVVPSTGHALVTDGLYKVAGGVQASLGLRILKPKQYASEKHVPIEKVVFSGGQRITAAIMLYAVVQQMRIRSRTRMERPGTGGMLILDNPLGAANSLELVELQRAMAEKMGLQLVIASPTEEYHLVDLFPTISRLVAGRRIKRGSKIYTMVENATYQLEPPAS